MLSSLAAFVYMHILNLLLLHQTVCNNDPQWLSALGYHYSRKVLNIFVTTAIFSLLRF